MLPVVQDRVYKNLLLVHILNLMKSVHALPSCCLKIYLIIVLQSTPGLYVLVAAIAIVIAVYEQEVY